MPTEPPNPAAPAPGLRVLLPDDTEITVPPVTIRQAKAALALHPADKAAEKFPAYIHRLEKELTILLGPSFDGLAGTLPPLTACDLVAMLWVSATDYQPHEPGCHLVWPEPRGTARPAAEMLATINLLADTLPKDFPLAPEQVHELALGTAFRLYHTIRPARMGLN